MAKTFFDYCLKIFVVVGTLFYMLPPPGHDALFWNYFCQEQFFIYGVMLLFALSLFSEPTRALKCKSLGVFFAYLIFTTLIGEFGEMEKYYLQGICFGFLFYKLVYERINLNDLRKYAAWLYWLLFANLVLCFFQMFRHDPIFQHIHINLVPTHELVIGFMRLQAALGILAAMIAPILFILHPLTSIIAIPLIIFSKSSAAAMAFVISIGFLSYFRMKKIHWILLVLAVLAAGAVYVIKYDMPSGQFGERFKIWEWSLRMTLLNKPFTGLGIGAFAKIAPQTPQITQAENMTWIWAHNEYLQTLFELGIAGFVMMICFIKVRIEDFFRNSWNLELQALFGCFISILIVSFFHFPFHMAKMVGLTLFLLAAFHAKSSELIHE